MAASLPKERNTSRCSQERSENLADVDRLVEELTIEDLMRGILRKIRLPSQNPDETGDGPDSILGLDIDGLHYSLVCSPSTQNHHLSPREQEIARLVAKGLPNKCISSVLEISTWTVATHLRRIFAKLGVSSRAAMVARLLDEGSIRELRRYVERTSLRKS